MKTSEPTKTRIKRFIAKWFLYLNISEWHGLMRPHCEIAMGPLSICQAAAWRACHRANSTWFSNFGSDGFGFNRQAIMEAPLCEYIRDWYIGRRWFIALRGKRINHFIWKMLWFKAGLRARIMMWKMGK